MAKKKMSEKETSEFVTEDVSEIVVEKPKSESKESAKAKSQPEPRILLTFDRWFAVQGKPLHWKAGMAAYIGKKSKGKKTVEEWDRLFAKY